MTHQTYFSGEHRDYPFGEPGQRPAFRYKSVVRSFCEAHGVKPESIRHQSNELYQELELTLRRTFQFHTHDYLMQVLEKMRSHEVG